MVIIPISIEVRINTSTAQTSEFVFVMRFKTLKGKCITLRSFDYYFFSNIVFLANEGKEIDVVKRTNNKSSYYDLKQGVVRDYEEPSEFL